MNIQNNKKGLWYILFVLISVFNISNLKAQDTPTWMKYIVREKITDSDYLESQMVLDSLSISTIHINMSASDYYTLIHQTNNNTYLLADMTYESPNIPLETINQVGIRLRGAAARGSRKKSFKISFRAFGNDDREFFGLRKLNLNSDFQDVHLMRAKTCTDLFRLMGVDAARVGYAKLYINDDYRGLFANYEDLDKAFLKTRFGDNNGDLYKCDGASFANHSGYWLTTNEETSDHSDINEFISVLNNTPFDDFKEEIEKVFDVDEMLMSTACNVLLGAWDDYWVLQKNFYLYHDLITDQFNHIPHDFDGSLGTYWYGQSMDVAIQNVYSWSPTPERPRPMILKLLEIPEYRDRYTHYLMLLCMHPFSLDAMGPEIDRTANMIRETLINDPYWGWSTLNFNVAMHQGLSGTNVKYGLKEYIDLRRNSALEQLEEIGPFIKEISRSPLLPTETDSVTICQLVVDRKNITSVKLAYKIGITYEQIEMFDNGVGSDERANDFIYTAQIPADETVHQVHYYVKATNDNSKSSRYPAANEWESYTINYEPPQILINEILASNDSTYNDNNGEYDDWFELYNPNDELIDLTGMYITDNFSNPRKWRLGNMTIPAKGFLLLWADSDPEQGSNHVGFKLSGNGEELGLYDTDENQNVLIDKIQFGSQTADISYGRSEDGGTEWVYFEEPTPGIGNNDTLVVVIIDELVDITNFEGTVIKGSNDDESWPGIGSPGAERIPNLIDNDVNTKYLVGEVQSWIEISSDTSSLVVAYTITSANDAPTRDPRSWELQGWDESVADWVTFHTVFGNPSWPSFFTPKIWTFTNNKWFNTYRLNITEINGDSQNLMQMAELEIWGKIAKEIDIIDTTDITDQMGTILEANNNSPADEGINNIIDNDDQTKYLTFSESTWIEYRHTESVFVNSYAITSANDVPDRDPQNWEFHGWDENNSQWITLHTVSNEPVWHTRFLKKEFSFNNTKSFKNYRLNITAGHGVDIIQIAELEIYGGVPTSIEDKEIQHPAKYILEQNYPNPFNPSTQIQYSISSPVHVKLTVYNVLGQYVKTLINQKINTGSYQVKWDGTDEKGTVVPNGVYFYRMKSDIGIKSKKMLLLR